jgi:hypothetical protein
MFLLKTTGTNIHPNNLVRGFIMRVIVFVLCFLWMFPSGYAQTKSAAKVMAAKEVEARVRKAKEKQGWLLVKGQDEYGKFERKGKVTEVRDKDFLLKDTCATCGEGHYLKFEQIYFIEQRSNVRRRLRDVPTKIGLYTLIYPVGMLAEYINSHRK